MPDLTTISPPTLLKRAIESVPAVKYALGVGGIIAVIAIISSFHIGWTVALFGTVVMFALMTVLVVFANLAGQKSSSFRVPALVLTWFGLILFMLTASILFVAVFWGNVDEIRTRLGITPAPLTTAVPQSPATVPTQQTSSQVNETESPINPASASSTTAKEAVPTPTASKTPKEDVPTPTASEIHDAQIEAEAQGHEAHGDTAALQSISYMYCGLAGCNNTPPNEANVEHARELWAYAVSQWTLAINLTHDTSYYRRLREKIGPDTSLISVHLRSWMVAQMEGRACQDVCPRS